MRWRDLLWDSISSWNDHDATTQSAALAFYTLFSLAPLTVVVVGVVGSIFGPDEVRQQIVTQFENWMGPEAASFVGLLLRSAARPVGSRLAVTLGSLTLVFGASGAFVQLQSSLNRVWEVAPKPGAVLTTLLRKRLLSFATLVGIGFLLIVSLLLSTSLHALGTYLAIQFGIPAGHLQVANLLASFLIVTLLFALIFRLLPDVKLTFADVALGAVVTSALFAIGKELIGLYLGHTGIASAYGAAGSLVILLLWLYYSSIIFLFGAELTRIWSQRTRGKPQLEEGVVPTHPAPRSGGTGRGAAITGCLLLGLLAGRAEAATPPRPTVKVEVEGLKGELRRNVLANLAIEQERKDKDLDEQKVHRLHDQAVDQIGEALQPYGYYQPVVQAALHHDGNTWTAHYGIDSGPQLKVTQRELSVDGPGHDDTGFAKVAADFPLHPGDPVNHLLYEAGKKSFEDYAADHGYLDATFRVNQIRIDLDAYTCDIVLHYDSGRQFRYGPVVFHETFLRPELLRGYVKLHEGEPISTTALRKLQSDLSASPYFSRVDVVPDRTAAHDDIVPIAVNLTPSKPYRWAGGVGYGTDTGPRAFLGFDMRHLNERGHYLTSEGRISLIERSFKVDYNIPGAYPRTDVFTTTAAYAKLDTDTSTTNSALVGEGWTQTILGGWRQALRLNLERATFTVGDDRGTSHLLTPQASWTRVWTNDRIFPTHGAKLELDLGAAAKSVLSNATFFQEHAHAKWITSPAKNFRLITRGELGYIEVSDRDFHLLPPIERFFAGGDQSVRGYAYQQLGPRDASDKVIGGRALATGSVEVEYRVLPKWGVATFFDAGNASQSLSFSLEEGTGFGIRWLSPIGLVRVDLAFAISRPGNPIRLHLNIGPDL